MNTEMHDTASAPARRVMFELAELMRLRVAITAWIPRTDTDWATRSRALASVEARRAGWWHVLTRIGARDGSLCFVYVQAVVVAEFEARAAARSWRESAIEWQARADGRPTSDAAGALSNWHELGVTV